MSVAPIPVSHVIRIALIGCGRISRNHFEAISKIERMTLVGVCDTIESRAREAGEQHGVPWFTDYAALLAQVPCDVIAQCLLSK